MSDHRRRPKHDHENFTANQLLFLHERKKLRDHERDQDMVAYITRRVVLRAIGPFRWSHSGELVPVREGVRVRAQGGILLVGDGAALLTAQEIGTRLHEGRNPVVVVMSIDAINGRAERCNDVPRRNWPLVPAAAGGRSARALRAGTLAEPTAAPETTAGPRGVVLPEAVLPKTDLPGALRARYPRPGRRQRPGPPVRPPDANGELDMSEEMRQWLEQVEEFANDPTPTNYLRLRSLTEAAIRNPPPETC
jgi:hypothetical protein